MGHKVGEKEKLYAFVLFWSVSTSKISDKLLVFD